MLVELLVIQLFISVPIVQINFILFVLTGVHVSVSTPDSIQMALSFL